MMIFNRLNASWSTQPERSPASTPDPKPASKASPYNHTRQFMHTHTGALVLAPLLAQSCGAWVHSASPSGLERAVGFPVDGRSTVAAVPSNGRATFMRTIPTTRRRRHRSLAIFAEPPATESASERETPRKGGSTSRMIARLPKPVGLMLAETEPGKPGLVVDELVEGGSAEQCGIVTPGMGLISACGVDCTELLFEEVLDVLETSPDDEPIDFVFSS